MEYPVNFAQCVFRLPTQGRPGGAESDGVLAPAFPLEVRFCGSLALARLTQPPRRRRGKPSLVGLPASAQPHWTHFGYRRYNA